MTGSQREDEDVPAALDMSPSSSSSATSSSGASTPPEASLPVPPPASLKRTDETDQPALVREICQKLLPPLMHTGSAASSAPFSPARSRADVSEPREPVITLDIPLQLASSDHATLQRNPEQPMEALSAPVPTRMGRGPALNLSMVGLQSTDEERDDTSGPAVKWGSASFELREQGWRVKVAWTRSRQNKSAYSLYWRRNLEPWVLHKEGVQGCSEEIQLKERESIASYWFVLHADATLDSELDAAQISGIVLGPLFPPSPPSGVRQVNAIEVAPGTIEVSWRPPLSQAGERAQVTDYEVLFENERQQQALTVCRGTRVQINDVDPDHCYTVQVCAVDALLGRGPYSMASRPINVKRTHLPAMPVDGCPTQSWNDTIKAPIPPEWRIWWPLDYLGCFFALLATMALDIELAVASYTVVEEPFHMAMLLSVYLVWGAIATIALKFAEWMLPPFLCIFITKICYIIVAAMFHLQVFAQTKRPVIGDYGRGFERHLFEWVKYACDHFLELPALGFSRQTFFLICLRGTAGWFAGVVKHLTLHVLLPDKAVSGGRCLGIVVSLLHSKSAPVGFALLAICMRAGLHVADAQHVIVLGVLHTMLVSACLGVLFGPHARRPAAALPLSQVSTRLMLTRCRSICDANVRRAMYNLLSIRHCSFTAEVAYILENWEGPNRTLWVWSARSLLLLDDQAPLLGIKNSCVLPTLVALLQRQLLGVEDELIASFEFALSKLLKTKPASLSEKAGRIILDVLTVSACLGESVDDLPGAASEKRKKQLEEAKEMYSVGGLYEALKHIADLSRIAVPCELLATTYIVSQTSHRGWLTCLGCVGCCRVPVLQHRLAVDRARHILYSSADQLQSKAAQKKSADSSVNDFYSNRFLGWCGACPRWLDVAAYEEQQFLRHLDKKFEKLIHSLFCLTGTNSGEPTATVAADRRGDQQLREFTSRYEEQIGKHFVAAKAAAELSTFQANSGATFCLEAMLARGTKKQVASLAYALSCLILGTDTSAVSGHLDVGLSYCAKELASNAGQNHKEKKMKHNSRLPRIIEALLRLRFFGRDLWTARTAYDVYTLAVEWCELCGGGLESFTVKDFLEITGSLRPWANISSPACPSHLEAPFAAVTALCDCEPRALEELFTYLLADMEMPVGNALSDAVLALIAWLDAERADLKDRMTDVASSRIQEFGSADGDPVGIDGLMLSAALALGFPSLVELTITVASCNIMALQFGLTLPANDEHARTQIPGPGVCLGAVLNLMQVVGQGPECPDLVLSALAESLAQDPRWKPLVDFVDKSKPCGFLAAIASAGGFEVPWAPSGQRGPHETEVTSLLMQFYMRIVRSGCVPPPAAPLSSPLPGREEDIVSWLLAYYDRRGDGLITAEDAIVLIQSVSGEPCDEYMYTQFCHQISRCPSVGLTVEDAKTMLKVLTDEQQKNLYDYLELGVGNYGDGLMRRSLKHRQMLEKKVATVTLNAWNLTDTLGLWLTHFFGPITAQVGLVLPDESTGASSSKCFSCCRATVKKGQASEIRGLVALQARPEELARSWRAAVERGVATLPQKGRLQSSRFGRSYRIAPHQADARLLSGDPVSSAYNRLERSFNDDLWHSKTVMTKGGMRRDEKQNLATLQDAHSRWHFLTHQWRIDLYTMPALACLSVLAVYEAAVLLLLPQFLLTTHGRALADIGSDAGRAGVVAGVLIALFLGQACGACHQGRCVRAVNTCLLPAPMKNVNVAINAWETDSLAGSVLTLAAGNLHGWAFVLTPQVQLPTAAAIAMLTVAAFLLGICRPLTETALLLRPRFGHADGYRQAPSLNVAYLCRTTAAAIVLPFLLWYFGWEERILTFDDIPEAGAALDLLASWKTQHFGNTGAALLMLGPMLVFFSFLSLVPWLASTLHKLPYLHPVRRALHYSEPPRIVGNGGPPIEGHPVVSNVTRQRLYISWISPSSTRILVYDAQVSIDYGIWQAARKLDIVWHNDRSDPCFSVANAKLLRDNTVRFRVRCAPVDALTDLENAEKGNGTVIWGPWSEPSAIIHKASFRPPLILRYLLILILAPVFLVHILFWTLPQAWLGRVAEKHKDTSLHIWRYTLLLVILPMVLVHLIFWQFPVWAIDRMRSKKWHWNTLPLALPLVIVAIPHAILHLTHQVKVKFRKSHDVEALPVATEFGPSCTLVVTRKSMQDLFTSEDDHALDANQMRILRDADFEDHSGPSGYEHPSIMKLTRACTRVLLTFGAVGKDNIGIDCVLCAAKHGGTALNRCIGARVIQQAEEALSDLSRNKSPGNPESSRGSSGLLHGERRRSTGGWVTSRSAPFMVLISSEVSADAEKLTALSVSAAMKGAVGVLLVLGPSNSQGPLVSELSLVIPLFCITDASAVKLQDKMTIAQSRSLKGPFTNPRASHFQSHHHQHCVTLSAMALGECVQDAEAVSASWTVEHRVPQHIALQYRPAVGEASDFEDTQWITCAVASAGCGSISVVLPHGAEDHDEFRLLGRTGGAWQPLSKHTPLSWSQRADPLPQSTSMAFGHMGSSVRMSSDSYDGVPGNTANFLSSSNAAIDGGAGIVKLTPLLDELARRNQSLAREGGQAKPQSANDDSGEDNTAPMRRRSVVAAQQKLKLAVTNQLPERVPTPEPASSQAHLENTSAPAQLEIGVSPVGAAVGTASDAMLAMRSLPRSDAGDNNGSDPDAKERYKDLEKKVEALTQRLEAQNLLAAEKDRGVDDALEAPYQLKRAAQARAEWLISAAKRHTREMETAEEEALGQTKRIEELENLVQNHSASSERHRSELEAMQQRTDELEKALKAAQGAHQAEGEQAADAAQKLQTAEQSKQAALEQVEAMARQLEKVRAEHREAQDQCQMLERLCVRVGEERLQMLHQRIGQMHDNALHLDMATDIVHQKQRLVYSSDYMSSEWDAGYW